MTEPVKTYYECATPNCRATDSDAGNNGPAPIALICPKCRTGSGMSPTEQFQRQVGLLPTHTNAASTSAAG